MIAAIIHPESFILYLFTGEASVRAAVGQFHFFLGGERLSGIGLLFRWLWIGRGTDAGAARRIA